MQGWKHLVVKILNVWKLTQCPWYVRNSGLDESATRPAVRDGGIEKSDAKFNIIDVSYNATSCLMGPTWQREAVLLNTNDAQVYKLYTFIITHGLPGHAWVLHLDNCEESPGHERPPLLGDGLLQSRTRVLSPPPQEAEHTPHGCHEPQLPSTTMTNPEHTS